MRTKTLRWILKTGAAECRMSLCGSWTFDLRECSRNVCTESSVATVLFAFAAEWRLWPALAAKWLLFNFRPEELLNPLSRVNHLVLALFTIFPLSAFGYWFVIIFKELYVKGILNLMMAIPFIYVRNLCPWSSKTEPVKNTFRTSFPEISQHWPKQRY
jgi:hypothetical protein